MKGFNLSVIVSIGLMLVSLIIIVGFLSNYQFVRTGFPGILFLILLGFVFGPMSNLVKREDVIGYAPYLAEIATILIIFEGGLSMNIRKIFRETPRALLLSLLHLVLCTVAVMIFMMLIGINPLYGALFGIMISGISVAVIVPLVHSIKVKDKVVTLVTLESTLYDVINVIFFFVIVGVITTGHLDLLTAARDIAASFCVGGVVGLLFGVFWLNMLLKIRREDFASMLTLAILFLAYYTSDYLGGSGALSSLLFGITLGNEREIYRVFKAEPNLEELVIDEFMIRFESELAFLIRTFFFVYIGLTINITDPLWIVYGAIISVLLLLMRFFATFLATIRSSLKSERQIISVFLSRGLTEAVLSVMFLNYGLPYSLLFQNIVFIVIIISNILCTVGVYNYTRLMRNLKNKCE